MDKFNVLDAVVLGRLNELMKVQNAVRFLAVPVATAKAHELVVFAVDQEQFNISYSNISGTLYNKVIHADGLPLFARL